MAEDFPVVASRAEDFPAVGFQVAAAPLEAAVPEEVFKI